MDPKHDGGRVFAAPSAHSAAESLGFPSADRRSFPSVDDHIVRPEVTRDEMIRGRKVIAAPALDPHADAQSHAAFLVSPHVRPGYVSSTELLTRVSEGSDFATDVSVRKEGIDPATGVRYLEELSFEIVNEQSMRDVTDKADELIKRGVRRVFAIFVKTGTICEWSRNKRAFVPMNQDGMFEDPLFVRPIAVRALIDRTFAEAEVVRALAKKQNPAIVTLEQTAEKKGLDEARRTVLLELLREYFGEVPAAIEARVHSADVVQVSVWTKKLRSASSLDDVFAQ